MLIETHVALFQSGWELAAMADLTKVIRALPEDIEKAGISTTYLISERFIQSQIWIILSLE